MRIAQLSSMTGCYGGEVHLAALAAGLRDRGHEVRGVVRPGSVLAERLPGAGIPVATLPLVDWYEPVGTLRLRAWLRRERIEVLHTHVPRDWYTAAVATLGTAVVNVATRHRLEPVGCPALKRPFLARLDALVAVSEAVHRALLAGRTLPPQRIVTVANGLDPSPPGPDRAAARAILGLDPAAAVVGFVGRLCPEKGLADLVAAAALLRPRWPGLQVAVLGDEAPGAGHAAALRRQADAAGLQGAVRFCGYRADAAALAAAFDVQAVPSLAEPFGLVVLEALAAGVPVVATRAGGIPEIVRDGQEGLLVPPGDAAALAVALERLLAEPALGARLAARGRQRLVREFGAARMAARTEAVYGRALRARAVRPTPACAARPAPRRR